MSLFPLPHGVIEKITRLQRNFLWGSSVGKKPFPLVKWDLIKLPKIHGGLNVSSIFFRNLGLLAKWLWRYFVESDALWRKIIQIKYGYSPTLTMIDLKSPPKGGPWRHLCKSIFSNQKAALLLSQGTRKSIGDGSNSLFWHESWLHERNLKSQFPRLFRLSKLPNGLISEMGSWTNNSWQWALSWKRDLRARDLEEWASLKTLIQKVVLCQNSRDNLIWCPQKSGQFSVKSFYTKLSKLTTPLAPSARRKIWRGLVPSRIYIFIWIACLEKLNTRNKLARLNIIHPSDMCALQFPCWILLASHTSLQILMAPLVMVVLYLVSSLDLPLNNYGSFRAMEPSPQNHFL